MAMSHAQDPVVVALGGCWHRPLCPGARLAVPADTVLPSQIPEGYNFRKYQRQTKKNWGGIAAVAFYCLALVLYFFVRVTKTTIVNSTAVRAYTQIPHP